MLPLAGKRWNPIFSVVATPDAARAPFETPIAARRVDGMGSSSHWRSAPARIGTATSAAARGRRHPLARRRPRGRGARPVRVGGCVGGVQCRPRASLRAAEIDRYIRLPDARDRRAMTLASPGSCRVNVRPANVRHRGEPRVPRQSRGVPFAGLRHCSPSSRVRDVGIGQWAVLLHPWSTDGLTQAQLSRRALRSNNRRWFGRSTAWIETA